MAIGVALIGYGMAGRYRHAPFLRPAGFDLRTIVTSRRDEVLAEFPSAEVVANPADALARCDVELVVIAAPNDLHASLAHEALEAARESAETGRRLTPAASRAIRYVSGASDV